MNDVKKVAFSPKSEQDAAHILQHIQTYAAAHSNRELRLLEAGCGQRWELDMGDIPYYLIGIDQSAEALQLRKERQQDLDEAIVGDLSTTEMPSSSFDIIYSSYVLEHVAGAQRVLENFTRWLKPGGLMVLRIPDADCAYGFLAKTTPFWMHVLIKRAMGHPNAGKPGYDPFPTYYDGVVSLRGMRAFCQAHGLRVLSEYSYGFRRFRPLYPFGHVAIKSVGLLSGGRIASDRSDLLYVLQKN